MNVALPRLAAAAAAGVCLWESVVHASLFANRQTPRLFGIDLSPRLNLIQSIVPAIASVLLAWLALGHRTSARANAALAADALGDLPRGLERVDLAERLVRA